MENKNAENPASPPPLHTGNRYGMRPLSVFRLIMAVFRHFHNLPSPPSAVHWNFPPISISMKRIATRAVTGSRPFNLSLVHGFFFFLLRDGPSPKWKWKESAGLFQFPQPEFSVFFFALTLCRRECAVSRLKLFHHLFCCSILLWFCLRSVCLRPRCLFYAALFHPGVFDGFNGNFPAFLGWDEGEKLPITRWVIESAKNWSGWSGVWRIGIDG